MESLDRPIIIVCGGRSGSTVFYRILAQHRDLGWLSTFNHVSPKQTWLSCFSRLYSKRIFDKVRHASFFPKPFAAYNFWRMYLPDITRHDRPLYSDDIPPEAIEPLREHVARVVKYQGKRRFLTKVTGWARMAYFNEVFPDAQFIYLRRDPIAIVGSWVRAGWLDVTSEIDSDSWEWGEVPDAYKAIWREMGRDPLISAAIKTQLDIDDLRSNVAQFPERTFSLNYEDFVAEPHELIRETMDFCGLPWSDRYDDVIRRMKLRSSPDGWKKYLSGAQADKVIDFFQRVDELSVACQ